MVPWNAIIWASVVIAFLLLFRAPIAKFLDRLSHLTFTADKSGVRVSFDARKAEAEVARALESKLGPLTDRALVSKEEIAQSIQKAAPRAQAERFARSEVLWVDDCPENNIHERNAFEAIGLRITDAYSTEEALNILKKRSFAVIISDMGRPRDPHAGYALLDALRRQGDKTPVIIYTGLLSGDRQRETIKHGGQGCTNRPDELFKLVTKAVIEGPNA
ncbi:MAG: response regulator receiver protein [Phycisphaerales bacterium]|nr:response regulator receiver protein [Phycisphaerales bacterium]